MSAIVLQALEGECCWVCGQLVECEPEPCTTPAPPPRERLPELRYDLADASETALAVAGYSGAGRDSVYAGLGRAESDALLDARVALCDWRERLGG